MEQQLNFVRNVAVVTAIISFSLCLFFFVVIVRVPLGMILAALGLVTVAAVVVSALVALSFGEEDEHTEH